MALMHKQVILKLFFNKSNMSFYVQIGDSLFMVKDRIAQILHDKENLEIRQAIDTKEMQVMSLQDDKLE